MPICLTVADGEHDIHGNRRYQYQVVSAYLNGSNQTVERHRMFYQNFDRLGRLVESYTLGRERNAVTGTWSSSSAGSPYHYDGLFEYRAYDGLGQQIRRWNSQLGSGVAETTLYDRNGRILTQVAMGGDTTTHAYVWNAAYATSGLGTFGGWEKTTTYANTKTSTEREDQFGRMIQKTDMGGNLSVYGYNLAGQLTSRTGGLTISYTYLNTGKLGSEITNTSSLFSVTNRGTTYTYDKAGNLLTEYLSESGNTTDWWSGYTSSYNHVLTNATATYDALGRMLTWTEAGSTLTPASAIVWQYDANGNIRSSANTYRTLNDQGQASTSSVTKTYWYRFDAMNRVVTDKGTLVSGQIVRGTNGMDIFYDAAGQRVHSDTSFWASTLIENPYYDPEYPGGPDPYVNPTHIPYEYLSTRREDYSYNAAGHLSTVYIATSSIDNESLVVTDPSGPGTRRAAFTYDAMGRQIQQIDYDTNGTTVVFDQATTYNNKSQVTLQDTYTRQSNSSNDWVRALTQTFYGRTTLTGADTAANYTLGAASYVSTNNYKNNVFQVTTSTANSYLWYDGASLSVASHKPNASQGTTYTSTHNYALVGGHAQLASVYIADGRSRTVTFYNDMTGKAIRRKEQDSGSGGDPNEVWYRFGGKEMGYTGNNGTRDTDYQTSIANRRATSNQNGAFWNRSTTAVSHAAFDTSVDKVNSYGQGSSASGYTVRAGETLASIAANLWGDSSLWYKLAEANGLSGSASLSEGQSIRIPAGVLKNTHNASTFKPFDPAETIGDTSPTTPKPPKKNKCGTFGQVLLVVVAVAVATVVSGGLASVAAGKSFLAGAGALANGTSLATIAGGKIGAAIAAGAAGGAAGSIASQAVGVATGIQDKFSWTGVASAAFSGALGGGGFLKGSNAFVEGAGTNAVSQAAAIALGPQSKFSWASVAAAGVGSFVGGKFADSKLGQSLEKVGSFASQIGTGTASAIANAATRTALGDGQFGDNIRAAIPDVIGQALGNALGDAVAGKVAGWNSSVAGGSYVDSSSSDFSGATPNIDAQAAYGDASAAELSLQFAGKIEDDVRRLDTVIVNGERITKADRQLWFLGEAVRATDQLNRISATRTDVYTENAIRRDTLDEGLSRFRRTGSMDEVLAKVTVTAEQTPISEISSNGHRVVSFNANGTVTVESPFGGGTVTVSETIYRQGLAANQGFSVEASAVIANNDAHTKIAARAAVFPLEFTGVGAASFIAADVLEDGQVRPGETARVLAEVALAKVGGKYLEKIFSKASGFADELYAKASGLGSPASSSAQGARLSEHLRQLERYGQQGFRELENGRLRYYGDVTPATRPGEMSGARLVREWDPSTGNKRTWYETIDHSGHVRSVAPKPPTHTENHLIFDKNGKYGGRR